MVSNIYKVVIIFLLNSKIIIIKVIIYDNLWLNNNIIIFTST